MSTHSQTRHPIHRFIRHLTFLWIFTVILYATLALLSNVLLDTALSAHDEDTSRVNALGIQRTYSQLIALESVQLIQVQDEAERALIRERLLSNVETMRSQLQALLSDSEVMDDLQVFFSDEAGDLNSRLNIYLLEAERLASAPDDELTLNHPALIHIEDNANSLLDDLNAQVSYYQQNTVDSLSGLQQINLVRMAAILGMLVFQTLFIFAPVRDRLREKATQLITEIAERERVQRTLEEKQHFIDQVTGDIPDQVYVYDIHSAHNVFSNRKISVQLGYAEDDSRLTKGSLIETLMPPEDYQKQVENAKRYTVLRDGDIMESEYRFKHADGSYRLMYVRETVFKRDAQGRVTQMLGIVQDVTDQREMERATIALRVDHKLEQERARLLTEFITNTSHDIRTPLSIVSTSLYMLKRHTDPARQQHYVEEIGGAITRLTHIIDQMHQMAQLEQADQLSSKQINLYDLLGDLQTRYQHVAEEKAVMLSYVLEENVTVMADYQWIIQAVDAVINNAIRNTPEHGEIHVNLWRVGTQAFIRVKDNGHGIEADALPHIFERFYKADSARPDDGSGAGMGLAMTKRIIEIYGGTVTVESVAGAGATFTITLPLYIEPSRMFA